MHTINENFVYSEMDRLLLIIRFIFQKILKKSEQILKIEKPLTRYQLKIVPGQDRQGCFFSLNVLIKFVTEI